MKELNIVNGEVLFENRKRFKFKGNVIPFNEAICDGIIVGYPFDEDFCQERVKSLSTTNSIYQDKVLRYIDEINLSYEKITLWFDFDMFCQMNLLCLLAYLEKIKYHQKVELVLLNDEWQEEIRYDIKLQGYIKTYEQVLWKKELVTTNIPSLNKGILLYLNYQKETNEIIDMIKSNLNLSTEKLLKKLMTNFPQYGLGDIQYLQLIAQAKDK